MPPDIFTSATPMSTAYTPPRQDDFFRYLEDAEEELYRFRLFLEGKEMLKDDEGNIEVRNTAGEPMLNQKGIHFVMTCLAPICTKNTYVSNLNEERMYELCESTANAFAIGLFKGMVGRRHENGTSGYYGIKKENFESICEAVNNFVEMSLRRAIDEGERGVIRSNRTENVTRSIVSEGGGGGNVWDFMRRHG